MNKRDIKKMLKGATISVYQVQRRIMDSYIWKAEVVVDPPSIGAESALRLDAQANATEYRSDIRYGVNAIPHHPDLFGTDNGGYYAVETKSKAQYAPGYRERGTARRDADVMDLLTEYVITHNLQSLYPACELSQVLAALNGLGAKVTTSKVAHENGHYVERSEWLKGKR